jgi:Zn finger protein HypA/HybF involved in hydrogenase expression
MTKYKYSDIDFAIAIGNSFSIREALKKLGVAPHGGSYKIFKTRIKNLKIDISHFTGQAHLKDKKNIHVKKVEFAEMLVSNSSRAMSSNHKQRIIEAGLLKNKCAKCSIENLWQGMPVILHIDHINGDNFDHRIENLRLLCPNCHSQTPTYCAKNKKYNSFKARVSEFIPQEHKKCATCSNMLRSNKNVNCGECYNKNRKLLQTQYKRTTKINWPSIDIIKSKLKTMSFLALAKEFGVSDNAIRKHIKNYQN